MPIKPLSFRGRVGAVKAVLPKTLAQKTKTKNKREERKEKDVGRKRSRQRRF